MRLTVGFNRGWGIMSSEYPVTLILDKGWICNSLYYQYKPEWLSTCPLTIHVLLHIAWGIKTAGPVWTYWAFPMERHCSSLLPSIKSRRHPYASISAFVSARAQLDQVQLIYNLQEELHLDNESGTPGNGLIHELCKESFKLEIQAFSK